MRGVIDEVLNRKAPAQRSARCLGLRHDRRDARAVTGDDLVAAVIAPVREHSDRLMSARFACLFAHRCELRAVAADIGDLVGEDEVMLGVDGKLDIVADDVCTFAMTRHGARVWVGERDLRAGRFLQSGAHSLQVLDPLAKPLDLFLESRRFFFGNFAAFSVGALQRDQIPSDVDLGLLDALGDLVDGEIVVAAIHGFELAAIDRHQRF